MGRKTTPLARHEPDAAAGKENDFDIEGLAARGDQVFLGLRGPVLRGWAIVLELQLKEKAQGVLKPRKIGGRGERYAKHFLDLEGLGVRDLLLEGEDLLILAGPTMDIDGPAAVYRWRSGTTAGRDSVSPRHELQKMVELPIGCGNDHPEGMALWPRNGQRQLLVVYDSPAPRRLHAPTTSSMPTSSRSMQGCGEGQARRNDCRFCAAPRRATREPATARPARARRSTPPADRPAR